MAAKKTDPVETAFPASAATPGQAESRQAREAFLEKREECPWWGDYLTLRLEGWDWRKAAYIAWASSPGFDRWPENQEDLARMLGLKSSRVLRKWREKDGTIDERVAAMQIEPLMKHRRDAINNLIQRASGDDKFAFQYLKIMFQMTGDLEGKNKKSSQRSALTGQAVSGQPEGGAAQLSDAELEQQIKNLQSVYSGGGHAGDEPDDSDE